MHHACKMTIRTPHVSDAFLFLFIDYIFFHLCQSSVVSSTLETLCTKIFWLFVLNSLGCTIYPRRCNIFLFSFFFHFFFFYILFFSLLSAKISTLHFSSHCTRWNVILYTYVFTHLTICIRWYQNSSVDRKFSRNTSALVLNVKGTFSFSLYGKSVSREIRLLIHISV